MENRDIEKQGEIDIAELVRSLWARRRFIIKVTGVVLVLGLLSALFGEVKFSSSTTVVPQTGQKASGGNLSGLAAMAGINLGSVEQGELLSPLIYPTIVSSVPFQKELMNSVVTVDGFDEPVTVFDYFMEDGYRKFSLSGFLKKYTIGLPGLILSALRGTPDNHVSVPSESGIEIITKDEQKCREILSERLSVSVNDKDGYITLSATMPEALMSAEVAARAQEMLQEYVTRFKVQKVQANLDFIEARYEEVKADFEAKQRALATFQDANRDISSAVARTRENRLTNEYNLAYSIYSEMARQREQASIKVKEDTPIFTVVEPVTIPVQRAAPRRAFIMVVSLFLGVCAGIGLVLVLPWIANTFEIKRLAGWRTNTFRADTSEA